MDLTHLLLFGIITGLLLQWKQVGSRPFDYFKSAALGASGTVLGGFLALVSYVTITNFSLSRLIILIVTLSAGIVLIQFSLGVNPPTGEAGRNTPLG